MPCDASHKSRIIIMAGQDKQIDWQRVEADYRAGQLSNVEIGKKHGMSEALVRKRAKMLGWTKDLTSKVREAVRAGLVRDGTNSTSDEEIVQEAGKIGAEVVKSHRKDIAKARDIVDRLMRELLDISNHRLTIEDIIYSDCKSDKSPKRREAMLRAVSLNARTVVIKDLSTALKTLTELERKAFSLDSEADTNKGLSLFDLVMASYGKGAPGAK
jgi:hypothetical protein